MCNHDNAKCIDSRPREIGRIRRYKCMTCGDRWTTIEMEIDSKGKGHNALDALKEAVGVINTKQENAIFNMIAAFSDKAE